ncbi:AT DNA binding protein [Cordyceps javanica]|uniref:Thymocyte nuclear protein 1 n=1 Tax=Cordyceps javanica TaxID=43265 RepID=A0A545VE85_9HYPO|nr:AT DNA binding protein [Cordyceps javanica]TQW10314.1 AT DNA binding protein [Cordyceps javanica]
MPARKRTSAAANGTNTGEPVTTRRSSRQAAAAAAPRAEAEAKTAREPGTTTQSAKSTSARPTKKDAGKVPSRANASVKRSAPPAEDADPRPAKATKSASSTAKSDKKQNKKAGTLKDDEKRATNRAGSEDPDVDSIPSVNPDAPKHEGEWYWLMKAEPETRMENGHDVRFSIDDLRAKTKPEGWDGIRAYPARNNMRNMNVGDKAFFYHSNCKEPGIVGIMEIVKEFSEDKSARRPGTPYYDLSSTKEKPKWDLVHVEFRKKFAVPIYLKELRKMGEAGGPLAEMQMLKLGRLSVSKVSAGEWKALCNLADEKAEEAGLKHEE